MKNVLSFICLATIRAISLAAKADTDRPVDIPPALRCLLNTSSTVYSVNAARKTSSTSNTPKVEVVVTKTGGKAKTEVTISSVSTITAGTLTTVKKRYTFEAGDYTRTKKFKVWGVEGLQVQVRLEKNPSVKNSNTPPGSTKSIRKEP